MREIPFQLRKIKLQLDFDEECLLSRPTPPEVVISCNGKEVMVGGPETLSSFCQESKHDYVWGLVSDVIADLHQRTNPRTHAEVEEARRIANEGAKSARNAKLDPSKFRVNRVAEPEAGAEV